MTQWLNLTGESGHYASAPDQVDFDTAGSIDVRARASNVAASGQGVLIGRRETFDEAVFDFKTDSGITATLEHFDSGHIEENEVQGGMADMTGDDIVDWRVVVDFITPEVHFYSRTNSSEPLDSDVGWTDEGTQALTNTDLDDTSTSELAVGALSAGAALRLNGRVYEAVFIHGVDAGTGTRIAYFNAEDFSVGDSDTDTAVDVDGNTWTIHGANSEIQSDAPAKLVGRSVHYDFTNRQVVIESGV